MRLSSDRITRIKIKYDRGGIIYDDYFEGPRMSAEVRKEIREKIHTFEMNEPKNESLLVSSIFHTMCSNEYRRVDPENELFIVMR